MTNRILTLAMWTPLFMGFSWVQAEVHQWNDPNGGVYGTFTKWDPIGFPAPQDTARFDLDANYKIAFIESRSAASLQIDDGIVNFDGSGIFGEADRVYMLGGAAISHGAELILARDNPNRDINLDIANMLDVIGTLTIRDSSTVASSRSVVDSFSSNFTALVQVDGTDGGALRSTWEVDDLVVGSADRGRLAIDGGGLGTSETAVLGNAPGSFGDAQVRGVSPDGLLASTWTITANSTPMLLGNEGRGQLTVAEGGQVVSQNVELGKLFGGVGEVTVRGVDASGLRSSWSTRDLTIGAGGDFGGSGSLQVFDGGLVSSGTSLIGAGQTVVQGDSAGGIASRWTTGELTVGDVKTAATLSILDAGTVTSGTTYIAKQSAKGTIALAGRGGGALTTWNSSGSVYVGGSQTAAGGSGELRIGAESQVDVAGTLKLWDGGRVELVQGALQATQIDKGSGAEFEFQSGRLQFDFFNGDLVNQGGRLTPGPGTASMEIAGDYTQQTAGTLDIEIGGLNPGTSHDELLVGGAVLLGGRLDLSVVDGFRPEANDTFDIFAARHVAGTFDNIANGERLATIDGSGSFVVHYGASSTFNPTHILLTDFEASGTLAGDFDLDGDIDGRDFFLWQLNDGSENGLTDWRNNYAAGSGPLAGTLALVPEPTSLLLMVIGATAMATCRP